MQLRSSAARARASGGAGAFSPSPLAARRPVAAARAAAAADADKASSSSPDLIDFSKATSAGPRQRRAENVAGAGFWVDDKCISCRVCRRMAPDVFGKVNDQSAALRAPSTPEQTKLAYQALLSCPTFSIHAEGKVDPAALRDARNGFPLPAFEGSEHVFSVGFTEIKAIATWSYVLNRDNGQNVLFDAPRFVPPAIDAVRSRCGPEGPAYFVLSHRDDIGEHERWAARFPNMRRVVHEREAEAVASLRECEVILRGDGPWRLPDGDGDVLIVLTPGHTSGSITLLYAPEQVALTGDHLDGAAPANEFGVVPPPPPERQELHAFRDFCWDSFDKQLVSVAKLSGRGIRRVLPGHGSPAFFGSSEEFEAALDRLLARELQGGQQAADRMLREAAEARAQEPAPVVPEDAVPVAAAVSR